MKILSHIKSFLSSLVYGAASIFDIHGHSNNTIIADDSAAIASDWEAVGNDIIQSYNSFLDEPRHRLRDEFGITFMRRMPSKSEETE